jgi:hypothetical protein
VVVEVGADPLDLLRRRIEVCDRDRRELLEAASRELDCDRVLDPGTPDERGGEPAGPGAEIDDRPGGLEPSTVEGVVELAHELLALDPARDVDLRLRIALDLLAEAELVGVGELRHRRPDS